MRYARHKNRGSCTCSVRIIGLDRSAAVNAPMTTPVMVPPTGLTEPGAALLCGRRGTSGPLRSTLLRRTRRIPRLWLRPRRPPIPAHRAPRPHAVGQSRGPGWGPSPPRLGRAGPVSRSGRRPGPAYTGVRPAHVIGGVSAGQLRPYALLAWAPGQHPPPNRGPRRAAGAVDPRDEGGWRHGPRPVPDGEGQEPLGHGSKRHPHPGRGVRQALAGRGLRHRPLLDRTAPGRACVPLPRGDADVVPAGLGEDVQLVGGVDQSRPHRVGGALAPPGHRPPP
jgi:hypothetical protein